MEHSQINKTETDLNKESAECKVGGRPRQLTTLKLQWIAERVRKVERIRKAIADGTYHVESEAVARAVLGLDSK